MARRSPFEMLMGGFQSMVRQKAATADAAPVPEPVEADPVEKRRKLPWTVWHLAERDASPVGPFSHLRPGVSMPAADATATSSPFAHLRPGADAIPVPSESDRIAPERRRWPR